MDIKSLQEWLRQNRQAGLSDAQIGKQLRSTGWTDQQITELFSGDMSRQGQLEAVGVSKKNDFDAMAGLAEYQAGSGGQLPGVFELMGQAWKLFTSRIAKLLAICLIAGILGSAIIGIVVMAGGAGAFFSISALGSESMGTGLLTHVFIMIGIWLAVSLVFSWIQAAILTALVDQTLTLGSILGHATKTMVSYWWITLLMSFFVGGASMLFGIPGIVLSIWFSFAVFILISENVHGMQALLKSKEYVRGYWWAVLGRNLALGLLITIPITLLSAGLTFAKQTTITAIVQGLILVLLLPYMLCYSFSIYSHLRAIKGTGMVVPDKKAGLLITAIIGWVLVPVMLFSIGGFALGGAKSRAADASRKSDLSQLRIAAVLYYDENHAYPFSLTELAPKYISTVPTDPKTNEPYTYTLLGNGSDFSICAQLDNKDVFGNKEYCVESGYSSSTNSYNSAFR